MLSYLICKAKNSYGTFIICWQTSNLWFFFCYFVFDLSQYLYVKSYNSIHFALVDNKFTCTLFLLIVEWLH